MTSSSEFNTSWEAQQILNDLRERLKKFGLTLSEKKTKLIEFGRFAQENRERNTQGKPDTFDCETKRENNNVRSDIIVPSEAKQTRVHTPWLATGENASEASTSSAACRAVHTLDFLGFTHYATKTSDGRFMVRVKTSRKKMNKATKAMNQWLKSVRNLTTLPEIWKQIAPRLQGHYNYYGLSGNFDGLQRFYRNTCAMVFKWMNRRSQKKTWNWSEFYAYLGRYPLPKPKLTYAIYNTW